MKKAFIITIDTESDNQWSKNSQLTTKNAEYLPRFQALCEKYGFKPVYLTDYTMANNEYFVRFAKDCLKNETCEIGMHLHAWDTPPIHKYDNYKETKPYLIEYPRGIMYDKLVNLTNILESKFEQKMISHRAGRWATNEIYFQILGELGYKVDCSVTPGVNWSKQQGINMGGTDYSRSSYDPYIILKDFNLLEVPVSIRKLFFLPLRFRNKRNIKSSLKNAMYSVIGKNVWLRPSISDEVEIQHLLNTLEEEDCNYIQFMMHSSEFMPGGSPYFSNDNDIEELYKALERLFKKISLRYEGKTLKEYYKTVVDVI